MKKSRPSNQFIKSPQYRGGLSAMRKFISENLNYPEQAKVEKINGSVYIRYEVNNKGKVVDTKVISGLGYGCNEEAERVVRLLEFDVEKVRKLRVTHHKKIRVWFKYQEQVKKVKNISKTIIHYDMKPSKKNGSKETGNNSNNRGYSYTIKF